MSMTRVTLTLDRSLLEKARGLSGGNFSRFVGALIEERLNSVKRQRLRDALREGCLAEAGTDLEILEEYQHIDREAARLAES